MNNKQIQILMKKTARSAESVLKSIEASSTMPSSMGYFNNLMRKVFCKKEGQESPDSFSGDNSKPMVGIYCMMVPEELIYAAGAIPVRLSGGTYEGAAIGDEMVPRDTCPIVKSSIGCTTTGVPSVYESCDVIIVPTTCDSKRKMAEELSEYKTVWTMEVPHVKDDENQRRIWFEHIMALKNNLEKLTGNRITGRSLKKAIRIMAGAQEQARRLYDIRMNNLPVVYGREAALALNAFAFDDAQYWTIAMTRLNDELSARLDNGNSICSEKTPRIMLASCPPVFPNWKLPMLIEEMGAIIAVDESCLGDRYLYDPVGISETTMREMLAALASRYIMPCVCPSFSPNDDRLYKLEEAVKAFNIEGIVYHVLKGCIIYDFELSRVEKLMKKFGIPVLRVETDYNPEDIEQLRTRIEAFIEVLKEKSKGDSRK